MNNTHYFASLHPAFSTHNIHNVDVVSSYMMVHVCTIHVDVVRKPCLCAFRCTTNMLHSITQHDNASWSNCFLILCTQGKSWLKRYGKCSYSRVLKTVALATVQPQSTTGTCLSLPPTHHHSSGLYSTRLETRTKESSKYASRTVLFRLVRRSESNWCD